MVPFDEERAEGGALDRLQDLGLSQYEAQTPLNLVRLGTGTTRDITRVNGVPRTRVSEEPATRTGGKSEETANWGTGDRNSLVVALRAIFT
ncbi:helix-turn-helix domain-containing protein [Halovalidus salilacus]|uniref:helix-turn-helix domain-containing protein n=1 Tax=Halovalidus salilacus TaxID=3075124 RepID=UPI00360DA906